MEQNIPKHHLKQEICATRPSYREGRTPKAVKVFTINNESKYILIQGVPSVGAVKELIQLCSSFGEVDEHHALDEYPCEDKYTEVHLVKYKRIQSARFAKRKLDEYSFFGGNLHVCYAPEYESVSETRGKLQERRRTIAAKIRRQRNEGGEGKTVQQASQSEQISSSATTSQLQGAIEQRKSTLPSTDFQSQENDDRGSLHNSQLSQSQPQSSHSSSAAESHNDLNKSYTLTLPPPPTPSMNKQIEPKCKYEYSRVPSKHSTLPTGFDGRLHINHQLELQTPILNTKSTDNNESTQLKTTSTPIDKNYKPSKPALKFVPRQAIKRTAENSTLDSKNRPDNLDEKIRKNAFLLVDQQGPPDLPGRRNKIPEITPGASRSYNDTIKTIRSKISKVITDTLKK